jgi:hypothetical protein
VYAAEMKFAYSGKNMIFDILGQYRIILSAEAVSEVRQMLSQKHR